MRLIPVGALALVFSHASAYRDTSPFFMFSTSDHARPVTSSSTLQSGKSLTFDTSNLLSQCSTDLYLIISQPGVRSSDYASKAAAPALSQRMVGGSKHGIRWSFTVAEVVGNVDVESWHNILEEHCGVQIAQIDAATGAIPTTYDMLPKVYNVHLPAPTEETRAKDIADNDAFFDLIISTIPSQNYTVLYVTSPGEMSLRTQVAEPEQYQMESPIQEAMHVDLRRDAGSPAMRKMDNATLVDGALFEKYQFLTPGLFMGFLVGFILLSILYVGISALASLQVSYAAFEKESGPLAAKKAQ